MLYDWIFATKELSKMVYALIICFICAAIVLKTDRLFKLSDHQGLRYFRNAFFFYGFSFVIKFILGGISNPLNDPVNNQIFFIITNYLFNFFIIIAGFFLLYSLIWKHIEKEKSYHSLLNFRIGFFYLISFLIVFLDILFETNYFMYFSQIILFATMVIISFKNYMKDGGVHKFLKYYFLTMILGLVAWVLNILAYYFIDWALIIKIHIYIINMFFFLFFLFAISKITNEKNG